MTNAISMNSLTKHYKDVRALTDLTLDVPGRDRLRLPRPERRRQDDGTQGPRRARPRNGRQRDGERRRRCQRPASTAGNSATSPRTRGSTAG